MARASTAPDPAQVPVAADALSPSTTPPATAVLFNEGLTPTWAPLASGLVRLAAKESLAVLLDDVTEETRVAAVTQGDFSIRIP